MFDFTDSIYKDRYERVMRESTVNRKRMEKQHEEELEKEQSLKKNVERKVSSMLKFLTLGSWLPELVCHFFGLFMQFKVLCR